jgi:hypothetical protein
MKRIALITILGLAVQLVVAQNVVDPTKKTDPQKGTAVTPAPPTKTGTATPAGDKKVEPTKSNTGSASEKAVAPAQDKVGTATPAVTKEPAKTGTESVIPQPEKKNEGTAVAPKPVVEPEKKETVTAVEVAVPAKPAIPAATPGAPATLSAEKTYTIANYNGLSLEALNGGEKAANVVVAVAKADANQKWRLIPAGDNFYYIVNDAHRYTLDIEGRVDQNGKNVRIWVPNGSNAQKFKLIPIGNDQYWIQTNNGNNISMDGTGSGANVMLRTSGQDVTQRWVIK